MEFTEDQIAFRVVNGSTALLPDGDYRLFNLHSGRVAVPKETGDDAQLVQMQANDQAIQLWHIKNLGNNDIMLTNKQTGFVLGVRGASGADDALAAQQRANNGNSQIWHLDVVGGDTYTLTNKGSGKVLDVFGQSLTDGSRIVQWSLNNGDNQQWQIK
ncbi:MAG: RICIN domain-containing protein [Abitibacteriaceae bacterium]|nr:RICIN domain-containing protein [Abditibacteriaceae bacterium]